MVAMRSAGDGAEGSLEGDDMVEGKMQRTHSGNAENEMEVEREKLLLMA